MFDTIPVVNVAQAAAKTILESPLICEAIIRRSSPYLEGRQRVGIVGIGNIGAALLRQLHRNGHSVTWFDKAADPGINAVPHEFRSPDVGTLLKRCDVVFGCTGSDALGSDWIGTLDHDLTLISCSSEDLEFRPLITLLRKRFRAKGEGHAVDIQASTGQATITIARGGFPINFDGSPESVPTADIQLTRGLLLGGVIQALGSDRRPGISMLAPSIQQHVVESWLRHRPERQSDYKAEIISCFQNNDWIAQHSLGHAGPSPGWL